MSCIFPLAVKLADKRTDHTLKRPFTGILEIKVKVEKNSRRGAFEIFNDGGAEDGLAAARDAVEL